MTDGKRPYVVTFKRGVDIDIKEKDIAVLGISGQSKQIKKSYFKFYTGITGSPGLDLYYVTMTSEYRHGTDVLSISGWGFVWRRQLAVKNHLMYQ